MAFGVEPSSSQGFVPSKALFLRVRIVRVIQYLKYIPGPDFKYLYKRGQDPTKSGTTGAPLSEVL